MRGSRYCVSWSGGKDSCFAAYLAIRKGMNISHLVHFDRPNNLHGVDPEMIKIQAELADIPLVQRKVDSGDFETQFKNTVVELARQGTKGMVFGDIFLEPHKEWVDRVCGDLGIDPIEPLWGMKTETIIEDFIRNGFETIVASGNHELIEKKIYRPTDGPGIYRISKISET